MDVIIHENQVLDKNQVVVFQQILSNFSLNFILPACYEKKKVFKHWHNSFFFLPLQAQITGSRDFIAQ
jgi:hypothetical protein